MMVPSDDAKLDALADHYENTYQEIAKTLARRDRTFLILILILGFFWLRLIIPGEIAAATNELAQNRLGLESAPNAVLLDSAFWCLLLAICIRYFQCVVEVNRLYEYIHLVEDELNVLFEKCAFTREGEFYSSNFHLFKWWTAVIYTAIFPLFLLSTIVIKIVREFSGDSIGLSTYFNAAICSFTAVSIGLFVFRDFANKFTKQGYGGSPSKPE